MTDSHLTPGTPPLAQRDESVVDPPSLDPLRLCVNATVALITCVLGPIALLYFSSTAMVGYARARKSGLMKSKCLLGDTRVVLGYLIVLTVIALATIPLWVMFWVGLFSRLIG